MLQTIVWEVRGEWAPGNAGLLSLEPCCLKAPLLNMSL